MCLQICREQTSRLDFLQILYENHPGFNCSQNSYDEVLAFTQEPLLSIALHEKLEKIYQVPILFQCHFSIHAWIQKLSYANILLNCHKAILYWTHLKTQIIVSCLFCIDKRKRSALSGHHHVNQGKQYRDIAHH